MKKNLSQSKTYRDFTRAREEALERLLAKYRAEISDMTGEFITSLMIAVRELHPAFTSDCDNGTAAEGIPARMKPRVEMMSRHYRKLVHRIRVTSNALAKAGEIEAISRSMNKRHELKFSNFNALALQGAPAVSGGAVEARARMYFDRLVRKVASQAQAVGLIRDSDGKPLSREDFMARVATVLPKAKPVPDRITLKRVQAREAGKPQAEEPMAMLGFMDRTTYDMILNDYLEEYVPRGRSPADVAEIARVVMPNGRMKDKVVYEWEIEREATNEFIAAVRHGQVQAANDAGINDFVWIAVLDNRTDECCEKRDGLLTSEIKLKLDGAWADDECQAIVPPAHLNCRCTLAPATENIPDRPEVDHGSFEAWLNEIPTT